MPATSSFTILTNSFHNTEYSSRKSREELEAMAYRVYGSLDASEAEKALVRKIRSKLCGIKGCTCGDDLGARD